MTDQIRQQELERRLEQSIRLLKQVDDPMTKVKLCELKEALETERILGKHLPSKQ
jgi:metal-sulfur cluster biosynthetic enzyme